MFDRTIKLIGEDNLNRIKDTTVCVVGIGGVGGYACEALVRSGVSNIIIVDYDNIDISNINRQIISNYNNIGSLKTKVMEDRIKSINPNVKVISINEFINKDNINKLFEYDFQYLIDACDSVNTKELLILECLKRSINFISCMGTGNKMDPSKLEITDIRKTSYDPLAKRIRKFVNDSHIKEKVPVVYSREQNSKFEGDIPSMIFVPASAGILCAKYIINSIINK